MKIWIDLTNSPHINFFKSLIADWSKEGHDIIITCRDLANTIDLIEQNGWDYNEVGGHAGASLKDKITYFPKRVLLLKRFLKHKKPDIAISHSSFYSPVAAKLLGIPSIYINDNEHAKGNYLAFAFATRVYLPKALESLAHRKKWNWLAKLIFYPGLKEGIYLSQTDLPELIAQKNSEHIKTVFVRPEPWTAQYYKGEKFFFDDFLKELSACYNVTLLPRGSKQAEHYKLSLGQVMNIADKPLSLHQIAATCDLFIGAGGSMTRELAILGVPTISIYQDQLLKVDEFLVENDVMIHEPNVSIENLKKLSEINPDKITNLIALGKIAYNMIFESLKI